MSTPASGLTLSALLMALALAAAPLACGDKPAVTPPGLDAGEPDAGDQFTTETLCGNLAKGHCALLGRCFTAFNRLEKDDCIAVETGKCTQVTDAVARSVREGRARYDEAAMKACLSRMESASCPAALPPTAPAIAVRAFEDCTAEKFFVGNVEDGSECRTAQECKGGSRCLIFGGACGGACTPYSKIGEPCSGVCNPASSFCDTSTAGNQFCVALKEEGGSCKDTSQCVASTDCRGSQCLSPPPLLAPCGYSAGRLPYCAAGLACDVVPYVAMNPGTCSNRKSEGEACLYHWSCKAGLVCAGMDWQPFPDKPAGAGKCAKPGAEGAKCSFTPYTIYVGDECAAGLSCDEKTGKCLKRPRNGEACTLAVQNCLGDYVYCKPDETGGGKCGGAPGIGEACSIDLGTFPVQLPCRDGYCDKDTKRCTAANAKEGATCYVDAQCLTARCIVQDDKTLKCGKRCANQ